MDSRISFITYNLWNKEFLERRKKALEMFFQSFDADLFVFQEVTPELLANIVDKALPNHLRVKDKDWTVGTVFAVLLLIVDDVMIGQ